MLKRFLFATHQQNRELAAAAGYQVGPDPDQPGRFQWTQREKGRTIAGCDASLDTEEEAWSEVIDLVLNNAIEDSGLTASEWEQSDQATKLAHVKESYFGF